ncbi:MAG TPA: hypothetical protein VM889_04500 [Candidatus Thermoplasmatota archaeon]|nr:hypothetical protein [Candidatus Thermoplasmatota archaeon]
MHPRLRFALVFVSTAVAAYLVAGCTSESDFYARADVDESGRSALAALGQFNCMEAGLLAAGTPECPRVPTGAKRPVEGILVLDNFYVQIMGPSGVDTSLQYATDPATAIRCAELRATGQGQALSGCSGPYTSLIAGSNSARASRGALPDMILPGVGQFHSAYGWWDNLDGDDFITVDDTGLEGARVVPGPKNEWILKPGATMVSYVTPGTHPTYDNPRRPAATEPDVHYAPLTTYHASTAVVYQQKNAGGDGDRLTGIVWIDGSLLRSIRVFTVTDPIFAASPDGLPFTPRTTSLVDIDDYSAVAPGPVTTLYSALFGPFMDEFASPSFGTCPNACIPGPVPTGGTALAEVGALQGFAFGRHESETHPASLGTAAGRQTDFEDQFHGWIDVIQMTRTTVSYQNLGAWGWSMQQPLGADPEGRPTIPPGGSISPEAWIGIFRDLSRDGRVGRVANPADPYEGGSRPMPDDYYRSEGEFYGLEPKLNKDNVLILTFTPDTDWGPVGVYSFYPDRMGDPIPPTTAGCLPGTASICLQVNGGSAQPFTTFLRPAGQYSAHPGASSTPAIESPFGHYGTHQAIWFPTGSPGFTVCTMDVPLTYAIGEVAVTETVRDCDYVAPWVSA